MPIELGQPLAAAGGEWISLQEASELLGVAESTVRRWGDSGRLAMKRTLGGHRRFPRAAVLKLAQNGAGQPAHPEAASGWGINSRELSRQEWHMRLAASADAERMRGLGQRLLGLLIQHLNRIDDDARSLAEARMVGVTYGAQARDAGISMHDTVEAFLFFRSAFSPLALQVPGISQPIDLAEAALLHKRIDQFMDTTLLGTIAGYESDAT